MERSYSMTMDQALISIDVTGYNACDINVPLATSVLLQTTKHRPTYNCHLFS
jgi:hypothetical protein